MSDIVYLVRHVAPPAEKRGRYWGKADPGVDAAGLEQVRTLPGLAWEKPARLFSSPLERALLTADELSGLLQLPVEILPELAETDFGVLDGLTWDEIGRVHPDAAQNWLEKGDHFTFPGGESIQAFFKRTTGAWKRCRDMDEAAVMVVSHAGVIACWICLFLGLPLARRFLFPPDYAALTAFMRRKDGGGWNMAFFNNRI